MPGGCEGGGLDAGRWRGRGSSGPAAPLRPPHHRRASRAGRESARYMVRRAGGCEQGSARVPVRAASPRRPPAAGARRSVEEAEHLASDGLAARLLVVHDAGRRGEHNHAKLARRQQPADPVLDLLVLDVVAGAAGGRAVFRRGEGASECEERAGNKRQCQEMAQFNAGAALTRLMTPVLFSLPFSSTTILPPRWSSTISNSPM